MAREASHRMEEETGRAHRSQRLRSGQAPGWGGGLWSVAELQGMAVEGFLPSSRPWRPQVGSVLTPPVPSPHLVLGPGPASTSSTALMSRCCLWWLSRLPPSRRHNNSG